MPGYACEWLKGPLSKDDQNFEKNKEDNFHPPPPKRRKTILIKMEVVCPELVITPATSKCSMNSVVPTH